MNVSSSLVISPVAVPYTGSIAGRLQQGGELEIQGTVPHHAHDGFSVNLTQGPQLEPTAVLHFNVRFGQNCLVMNALQNGSWGSEERHEQPFHKGQPFDLRILIKPQMFKIKVNGRHIADFAHRMPKETAQFIVIDGQVSVNFLKIHSSHPGPKFPAGEPFGYGPPGIPAGAAPSPAPGYSPQPIYNPPVPFMGAIPGGLSPGRMVSVSGVPHPNASGFTINLQCGNYEGCDIALHFNVRIRGNDGSINTIVRNTKSGGNWGGEERDVSYFPFMPNANFDVLFLAEPQGFKVAVNNQHLLEYRHRMPIQNINTLYVDGDLRLNQIRFQ